MTFGLALLLLLALSNSPHAVEVERYRLQSNPWVNLHQRLLYEARFSSAPPEGLTAEETTAWKAAVEAYRAFLRKRSPIFDRELIRMNAALSLTRGADLPEAVPEPAREALRRAMPPYERVRWAHDDIANRFWIAIAEPMLASAAGELMAAHAKAYGRPMPKHVLVDVCTFGWEFGAYTVGDADSVHSVIASVEPGQQGFAALEFLMHEPSHGIVEPESGAIGADLTRAAKELNRKPPYNLWHALLFYTSGELTRRALHRRGVTDYVPIIYKGMFDRQFRGFQQPIETHWGAYLDGTLGREEAVKRILLETTNEEKPN